MLDLDAGHMCARSTHTQEIILLFISFTTFSHTNMFAINAQWRLLTYCTGEVLSAKKWPLVFKCLLQTTNTLHDR